MLGGLESLVLCYLHQYTRVDRGSCCEYLPVGHFGGNGGCFLFSCCVENRSENVYIYIVAAGVVIGASGED